MRAPVKSIASEFGRLLKTSRLNSVIGNFPLNWFRESKPAGAYRGTPTRSVGWKSRFRTDFPRRSPCNTLRLITANNLRVCTSFVDFWCHKLSVWRKNEREKPVMADRVAGGFYHARFFHRSKRRRRSREANYSFYLSFCGRGNPSSVQEKCGVGLPIAIHLSDTEGPGCIVCSMNLYRSWGAASRRR